VIMLTPICRRVLAEDVFRGARLPISPDRVKPHALMRNSGYIFAGTVVRVERTAAAKNRVAAIQVTFHVEKALRGVHTGQMLVIREWPGLWQAGERYRPGERVMLFLYPPSKLGLTSPVGAAMGRFQVDQDGRIPVEPGRIQAGMPLPRHAKIPEQTRITPAQLLRTLRRSDEE